MAVCSSVISRAEQHGKAFHVRSDLFVGLQEWWGEPDGDVCKIRQGKLLLSFTYGVVYSPMVLVLVVVGVILQFSISGDGLALEAALRFTRQSVEIDEDQGALD